MAQYAYMANTFPPWALTLVAKRQKAILIFNGKYSFILFFYILLIVIVNMTLNYPRLIDFENPKTSQ